MIYASLGSCTRSPSDGLLVIRLHLSDIGWRMSSTVFHYIFRFHEFWIYHKGFLFSFLNSQTASRRNLSCLFPISLIIGRFLLAVRLSPLSQLYSPPFDEIIERGNCLFQFLTVDFNSKKVSTRERVKGLLLLDIR